MHGSKPSATPLKFDNCLSSIVWMDADVQLISCWEECFFRRKKNSFFSPLLSLSFFSDTYFIFMFVSRTAKRCIWSPNQESYTPPLKSQLSKCLSLWNLPKQAVGRAHWTDDPHLIEKEKEKEKKNHFLIFARKNGTNGIFHVTLPFTFLCNSFSD